MGAPQYPVRRVQVGPTDHDEMICEFRAAISNYQIQPKTGALNLGLLVAFQYLTDEVMDLGRHAGMELVVQVYKPEPRASVLDMAREDENPLGENDDKVVQFVKGFLTPEDKEGKEGNGEGVGSKS